MKLKFILGLAILVHFVRTYFRFDDDDNCSLHHHRI